MRRERVYRAALVVGVVLLAGILLFAAGSVTGSSAASSEVDCVAGASATSCAITDATGIRSVRVEEETAAGSNLAVDEVYSTCPTEVEVKWTPLAPHYRVTVVDCGSPAVMEEVFSFDGFAHEGLGLAALDLRPLSLRATNFGRLGNDGIAVDVGAASLWSALIYPQAPLERGTFSATVYPVGGLTQVAELGVTDYMTDVIVHLPSSTYDVDLYRTGTAVHAADAIPNGTSYLSLAAPFCEGAGDLSTCVPRLTFGVDPEGSRAYWELELPTPISVTVPTMAVSTDRLRFTASSAPLRQLTIGSIALTGTELPALTLYSEEIRAPLPSTGLYLPVVLGGGGPADPFGFDALTDFMGSDPDVGESRQISPDLSVRVVGTGELISETVAMPSGDVPDDGLPDPEEVPPPRALPQTLRVFNTGSQKEFEVVVAGELLAQLGRLMQGSGAGPGGGAAQGVDALLLRDRVAVMGWSDGVDNRVYLSGTTWWPWRTIVHFSNNCSGTLVGPRHILTAAHCVNKRGTNQWYSFTATPGRDGTDKPYGDTQMNPNPQPGDPFRWYFTPAAWRDPQYNEANCAGSCFPASQHDWALIIIPEYLGYQTGWMGYVARPGSQLNVQAHFNRGYPVCNSGNGNSPDGCDYGELFGDAQICGLGSYSYLDSSGWNRLIRNSCDLNGGHSGSPVYHYYYDPYLGQTVPVVAMVEVWEHCYTCAAGDDTPNTARRLTPSSTNIITFFRQWKP